MTIAVSVLLPAHNAEQYIDQTIESVIAQTFSEWELIIIDDHSQDQTHQRSLDWAAKDRRIRVVRSEGRGVALALNAGLALARGAFIARIDADDCMLPDRLLEQYRWLEQHSKYVLCATTATEIDEKGRLGRAIGRGMDDAGLRRLLPHYNVIIHPSVMIRKQGLVSVGGWREDCEGCEDYALWLALLDQGRMVVLASSGLLYRRHPGQVTQKKAIHMAALESAIGCEQSGLLGEALDSARRRRFIRNVRWAIAEGARGQVALLAAAWRVARYRWELRREWTRLLISVLKWKRTPDLFFLGHLSTSSVWFLLLVVLRRFRHRS